MSLEGYQRALAELVRSAPLRQAVAGLPEPELPPALAALELTEVERRRLHAVARDKGLRVATMLHRATRLSMLSNTLERTCYALGAAQLKPLVQRFWLENEFTTSLFMVEARRFGAFLHERLRTGELVHPLLPELLEAELTLSELRQEGPARPSPAGPLPSGPALEGAHPERTPHCRVVPMPRPPEDVLQALGRPSIAWPEGSTHLLMETRSDGNVLMSALDALRGRALLASTGERSVARLGAELGCPSALFLELAERGLLRLSAPRAPRPS